MLPARPRGLVEAGVKLVQINWLRSNIGGIKAASDSTRARTTSPRFATRLYPPADQAFSVLLEDLEERGLLDETLVLFYNEFGRTPKVNPKAGRDHWPQCYSTLLAGGGNQGGVVYGASDKISSF